MNEEDIRMQDDEQDAGREHYISPSQGEAIEEVEHPQSTDKHGGNGHRSPNTGAGSASSRCSINSNPRRPVDAMSRMATDHDSGAGNLERHQTTLSRIQTAKSQHSYTIGTAIRSRTVTRQSKRPMPNFGAGKQFPPPLPDREEYVVEFDGPDDPLHAQNWPFRKKFRIAAILAYITLTAAFGSSIFSTVLGSISEKFDIGSITSVLGVSLYVLGFATGPLVWAPASELYGRRLPIIISSFAFSIFNIAVAVAKDVQTVFICRFFAGFAGACPLTIVGAVFADMFSNRERGLAVTIYAIAVFSGPQLAPFIGGFINMSYLGWRWTEYITAIMGFFGLALSILFVPETYAPLILVAKAADLRRRTKNWGIHAKQEEIEIDFRELVEKNFSRPLRMLIFEPIVLAISIYLAFVYGLLYLLLSFYPIVFQGVHGFNQGVGGLPFLGLIFGEILAGIYIAICQPSYSRKLAANNNIPIPEWRLPPAIVGGVVFAVGIFWLGWTGYDPSIHWIPPTLSGLCTGFGLLTIFLQCLNYLIDAYLMFAASAIAANTLLRSLAGAGFPLFARQMIDGLGVQYAATLLGGVAVILVPMPVVFYLRGAKIRQKSTFAPTFSTANAAHVPISESDGEEKRPGEEESRKF